MHEFRPKVYSAQIQSDNLKGELSLSLRTCFQEPCISTSNNKASETSLEMQCTAISIHRPLISWPSLCFVPKSKVITHAKTGEGIEKDLKIKPQRQY